MGLGIGIGVAQHLLRQFGSAPVSFGPPATGPHASWTGVADTGSGAPASVARTTAKPAMQWWTPSYQRTTGDLVIGVDADAKGGVASVQFSGDIATITVNAPTLYVDTDVNGNTRVRYGFWIKVTNAAMVAKAAAGTANIYAKGTANDGTMQPRVIGPIKMFPRGTAIVKSYNITPSAGADTATAGGGTFRTLAAARTQFVTDAPESAEFVFTETATYDVPAWSGSFYPSHTGYAVFRAAGGVTATLTRGTVFTPDPTLGLADWNMEWIWATFTGPAEFRGSGIVFDMRFWCVIQVFGTNPHWFNGCTIKNSAGRDQLEWNKQAHPGFKTWNNSSSGIDSYFTDILVTDVSGFSGALMLTGMRAHNAWANHDQSHFIANCYETGSDPSFFFNSAPALTVSYSGAGTARCAGDTNARTFDCQVDSGSGFVSVGGTFPLSFTVDQTGQRPSDTYYNMSAVAAAINAIPGGAWTATVADASRAGCALMGNTTVIAGATAIQGRYDIHSEWFHAIGGLSAHLENVTIRNNTVRRAYFTTSPVNCEAPLWDGIIKGNIWECSAQSGANGGFTGLHLVASDNYYDGPCPIGDPAYWDSYGLVTRNIFNGVAQNGGWSTVPVVKDNATTGALPTGTQNTGNFQIIDMDGDIINGKVAGDFSAKVGGKLTLNKKTPLDTYDAQGGSYAAPDVVGPWRLGAVAPTYPF
jgi:hypothetical protein